ncbi:MAG TPA: copper homeostasis protein CutC [Cytophagales bacterium]|nr:copper homeostasis protein CutC [Cytophagales bacterium]
MRTLEIACDTVTSALAAAEGGADRIELVAALGEGGLTPSLGKFLTIKEQVSIPIFVMIRPRRADFCYPDADFHEMLRDVALFREQGADGIVSGVLLPDGHVDVERTSKLREAAGELPFTFHRAFDMTPNVLESMDSLIRVGVDRILTSGGKASAPKGSSELRRLAFQAKDRIKIMAGAGIQRHNLPLLLNFPGLTEFHASAKGKAESAMTYRGTAAMGHDDSSEFSWYETQVELVRELKECLS